jgi:hypothetical protein
LSLITTFVITHLGNSNLTTDNNFFTAYTFVVYRSQNPDNATVQEVLKKMKENEIDGNSWWNTGQITAKGEIGQQKRFR